MRYVLSREFYGIKIYAQDCLAYQLGAMDTAYRFCKKDADAVQEQHSMYGIDMLLENAVEYSEEDDRCFAVSFLDSDSLKRLYIPSYLWWDFVEERLLGKKFSHQSAVNMLSEFCPEDDAQIEYVPEWDWRQQILVVDFPDVVVVK